MKKIRIKIRGRPGWHIECSVMSSKFLKTDTLDIHAGGRDLIFPHHENEIAQAQTLTGKPFAKYWIHHGLLTINSQKMAKSLGNFVTIKDFIAKYKTADLLKLFFLSTHYSHPIDYSQQSIEEARKQKERFAILFDKIERRLSQGKNASKAKEIKEIEGFKNKFIEVMDDDFNTAEGLACLFELVNAANKNIDNLEFIYSARMVLKELLGIFGIGEEINETAIIDQEVALKIEERNQARKKGDYALADKIRKELFQQGIILEDEKAGKTTWRRKI